MLGWYDGIVEAVDELTKGRPLSERGRTSFAALRDALGPALDRDAADSLVAAVAEDAAGLEREEVVSNAAVLMFGGIETTEGMIANAVAHLLAHPGQRARVGPTRACWRAPSRSRCGSSRRRRCSTATRRATWSSAAPRSGAATSSGSRSPAANRDPETFPDPDRFDVERPNAGRHLAFARGPHVCIGMHLARLEAHTAVGRLLARLPGLRLDTGHPAAPRGLVFRKPPELRVLWD